MVKGILIFVFVMSLLNVLRELVRFYFAFRNETKYESNEVRTTATFASIALIITILICGF